MRQRFGSSLVAVLLLAWSVAFAQPPAAGATDGSPITWLIFVDDLHLEFRNTGRIRDALRTTMKELIEDGDRFAMATAGPSAIAVDLTDNRQLLDAAIKMVIGNALKFDDVMDAAGGPVEARYRASTALSAAQAMLGNRALAADGSTIMLYVSSGYSVDLLPEGLPGSLPRRFNITREQVRAQLAQLIEAASRAGIRIVTLDPWMAFADPAAAPTHPAWPDHREAMRASMRSVAEESGGFAIEGDLRTQLQRLKDAIRR